MQNMKIDLIVCVHIYMNVYDSRWYANFYMHTMLARLAWFYCLFFFHFLISVAGFTLLLFFFSSIFTWSTISANAAHMLLWLNDYIKSILIINIFYVYWIIIHLKFKFRITIHQRRQHVYWLHRFSLKCDMNSICLLKRVSIN